MAPFQAGGAWPGAVAVSGGGDSLALMYLLARWAAAQKSTAPVILIVDHGLRPGSAKEARDVAKRAQSLGLRATVLRWKMQRESGGLEAAAREARYRLMGAWLKRHKLATLYVAHNQDDQAETFLLRLARGSGLDGLAAMRALGAYPHPDYSQLAVARPLLGIGRARLRDYLTAIGEEWLDDPMNEDLRFDRVKLRQLTPALAGAGLTAARIALAASHMASARDLMGGLTALLVDRIGQGASDGILIDQYGLAAAPRELGLRALAALLQRVSGAPYRPRFASLEVLFDRIVMGDLGGGATLGGCRLGPAPARERVFGPKTLKLTLEKRVKVPHVQAHGGVAGRMQRS
jgi:tRNA(Ile)-lysidine synthase